MKFQVIVTVKNKSGDPVDIKWYDGDNHAEALAALVSAAAKDVGDPNMPDDIRTYVTSARIDIYHPELNDSVCSRLKFMDEKYETSEDSPLHHDQRCTDCK